MHITDSAWASKSAGYLHKLLRNFDEDAYHDVKASQPIWIGMAKPIWARAVLWRASALRVLLRSVLQSSFLVFHVFLQFCWVHERRWFLIVFCSICCTIVRAPVHQPLVHVSARPTLNIIEPISQSKIIGPLLKIVNFQQPWSKNTWGSTYQLAKHVTESLDWQGNLATANAEKLPWIKEDTQPWVCRGGHSILCTAYLWMENM